MLHRKNYGHHDSSDKATDGADDALDYGGAGARNGFSLALPSLIHGVEGEVVGPEAVGERA